MSLPKLVIGNWKMSGSPAALWAFADLVRREPPACMAALCVPSPLLSAAQAALQATPLRWGAQDCSAHADGAHTGEVSAELIARFGARYVIVGHSERRTAWSETDGLVVDKVQRVLAAEMTPVVCIGETAAERDGNQTQTVLRRQLLQLVRTFGRTLTSVVIAYEPVWAIGSGDTAAPGIINDTHGFIAQTLSFHAGLSAQSVRILYGGSVNPRNAAAILASPLVAGVLVGAASQRPGDFIEICRAAARCADEGELMSVSA
jgi:triosephosphate isomerase